MELLIIAILVVVVFAVYCFFTEEDNPDNITEEEIRDYLSRNEERKCRIVEAEKTMLETYSSEALFVRGMCLSAIIALRKRNGYPVIEEERIRQMGFVQFECDYTHGADFRGEHWPKFDLGKFIKRSRSPLGSYEDELREWANTDATGDELYQQVFAKLLGYAKMLETERIKEQQEKVERLRRERQRLRDVEILRELKRQGRL